MTQADAQYAILEAARPLSGDTALAFGEVKMGLKQPEQAREFFMRVLEEAPENKQRHGPVRFHARIRFVLCGQFAFHREPLEPTGYRHRRSVGSPIKNGLLIAGEKEASAASANPWNDRSYLDIYYSASQIDRDLEECRNRYREV